MKSSGLKYVLILAMTALLGLAGCQSTTWKDLTQSIAIVNLTPGVFPENPSGVYTFSVNVKPLASTVLKETVRVNLVIDGEVYPMKPSPLAATVWEYDHPIAVGRESAKYFYQVSYLVEGRVSTKQRQITSEQVSRIRIANRYALALETVRGPVGATIGILGRGFARGDVVVVGDLPAATTFFSQNALQFAVPAVEPGSAYRVQVRTADGDVDVGLFRVDPGVVAVTPASLFLTKGQRVSVTFTVPAPAGMGGTVVDVTTDAAASVVMPEVVIPEGRTSVTVPVIGGEPGSGTIFVRAPGAPEVMVPVVVR